LRRPIELGGPHWALSFGFCLVLLGATRAMLWRWLDHEVFQRRVLVLGAGKRAASLLRLRRRSDRRGFHIAAFIRSEGDENVVVDRDRIAELKRSLLDYAQENRVDEIVVAMDDRRRGFPVSELLSCKFAGIAVVDLLAFLERETGRVSVELVNPSWLIFSESFGWRARFEFATRAIDLVSALLILLLAAPLMCLIALLILIDDGMPIFYRQRRVGLMGKTFTLFKFRSMIRNAEGDGTPRWANAGDARVTRIGGLLRKLRLDELPQLFNVVSGSMSLVGPRPERPEFVDALSREIPYYQERHCVRPGITGWAQLCYPYGSSVRDALEKLQYDLYYIKHKSLVLDLMILSS
jgi:sugar transferase (PEP-CTERM system associated)